MRLSGTFNAFMGRRSCLDRNKSMTRNSIKFSTLKPLLINLSEPPRSNRFITNINASTLPLETSINFEAASAVLL